MLGLWAVLRQMAVIHIKAVEANAIAPIPLLLIPVHLPAIGHEPAAALQLGIGHPGPLG